MIPMNQTLQWAWYQWIRRCSGHDTNESDSAVGMTPMSQTLLCARHRRVRHCCAWHRRVRLCCVHDTEESNSAVGMTPKSQTLLCAWHWRVRLCCVHDTKESNSYRRVKYTKFVKELHSRHYTRAQQARNQNLKLAGLWLLWNRQLGKVFLWVNTPTI